MKFAVALLVVISLQCACAAPQDFTDDPDCWVFRQRGRALSGRNDRVLRNVPSEDVCAQACVDEGEFACASMEYKAQFKKCFLSTYTRASDGAKFVPSRGMTYRERKLPCGGGDVSENEEFDRVVIPKSSGPIEFDGTLTGATFNASGPGFMFLQVYRNEGAYLYSLVGEFKLEAEDAGVYTVNLPPGDHIQVLSGDVFGLRFNDPVPISYDTDAKGGLYLAASVSGDVPVGTTLAFKEIEADGTYSVEALFSE